MLLSVCIPMYNESAIVADTLRALDDALSAWAAGTGNDYELLFMDDGSADGSARKVAALAREDGRTRVRVEGYPDNRGKGAAVREAVLASRGDAVLFTDCDLAYGTDVIGVFADAVRDGADVAIGSRRLHPGGYADYTPVRRLASEIFVRILRIAAGFRLSDSQCGCKAFRGEVGRRIFRLCETDGFAFDQEFLMIAAKAGIPIREIPVKVVNHRASKVRLFRDSFRMLRDVLRIRRRVRTLDVSSVTA